MNIHAFIIVKESSKDISTVGDTLRCPVLIHAFAIVALCVSKLPTQKSHWFPVKTQKTTRKAWTSDQMYFVCFISYILPIYIYMIIYIWYWYSYTVIHIIYIYMYNCTCIESYVIWHPLMGIASRKSEKLIDFNQRRIRISKWMQKMKLPIGSMYGIFTHIYHKTEPNVPHAGQYIIHGSYGNTKYGAIIEPVGLAFVDESCFGWTVLNPSKQ